MASLTKFKYGGYTTSDGDTRLIRHEITAAMSRRGNRWGEWHRLHLEIELQAASPAALHSDMGNMTEAFMQNDKTAVLLFPDGTETKHKLDQDSPFNYSGNKVVHFSWEDLDAGQLVNARTARIVIAALFVNEDSQIIHFHDNILTLGSGGRRIRWVESPAGFPILQQIYQSTPRTVIQTGMIVALSVFPVGNISPPILPDFEDTHRRQITQLYPRWVGRTWVDYGYKWRYRMNIDANEPIPQGLPFFIPEPPVHPRL